MKRDMGLIRKIAFIVEECDGNLISSSIQIEGFSSKQIGYHCALMNESQLIDCIDTDELVCQHPQFIINRLTSRGHDFADAARNEGVWKKTITTIKNTVGSATVEVLMQYLKLELRKTLGLPEA